MAALQLDVSPGTLWPLLAGPVEVERLLSVQRRLGAAGARAVST